MKLVIFQNLKKIIYSIVMSKPAITWVKRQKNMDFRSAYASNKRFLYEQNSMLFKTIKILCATLKRQTQKE
jgi:hypothetical protein